MDAWMSACMHAWMDGVMSVGIYVSMYNECMNVTI